MDVTGQMKITPNVERFALSAPVVKACDACRSRKIKCDKKSPCSSCKTLDISCKRTPKSNEQRHQRVLISHEYERKVDRIDERLRQIDHLLQQLLHSTQPVNNALMVQHNRELSRLQKPSLGLNNTSRATLEGSSDAVFEGDTSLMAHSLHAKALFEREISNLIALRSSSKLRSALSTLQDTLKAQNDPSEFHNLNVSHSDERISDEDSSPEMPPLGVVLEILSSIKKKTPRFFLEFPVLESGSFQILCQKVYFAVDQYSPAAFMLVNGTLVYLFTELCHGLPLETISEYQRYADICRSNIGRSLQKFDLLAAPSLENCQALAFGAIYGMDISKPAVFVRLTSAAVEMCRSLGYHRISKARSNANSEKRIFWTIYVLDKIVSLAVGRTSILQDCDISTQLIEYPADHQQKPWHQLYLSWISLAKVQGQIYQDLFTVSAIAGPIIERTRRATALVAEIQTWYRNEHCAIEASNVYFPNAFQATYKTMDVAFFATLTTVQRVIPPIDSEQYSGISTDCLESARAALRAHQELVRNYFRSREEYSTYVIWTIIYSPFSPIVVIFSYIIKTRSIPDLEILRAFATSLRPITDSEDSTLDQPTAIKRLYDLCDAFCNVAEAFIEASALAGEGDDFLLNPDPLFPIDDNIFWPVEDIIIGDQSLGRFFDGGFWGA